MKHAKKLFGLFAVAFLLISFSNFGSAWWNSSYSYRQETLNTPDNSLIFPFVDEDPDGDGQTSTYYGQNGSIYYNNDDDFAFANDTSQRFGASTIIDGSKNQQITGSAPSSLKAYYPLDNDNAKDISGNGNDGTLNGGVTTGATGQVKNAYDFDGNSDIDISSGDPIGSQPTAFTLAGWAKTSDSGDNVIVHITGSNSDIARIMVKSSVARLGVYDDSTGFDAVDGSTNIDDGNWHYIVGVFDDTATNEMKVYVDGSFEGEISTTNLPDFSGTRSDRPDSIGSRGDSYYMNGTIDDVRIYDRALSSAEIQTIYDSTKPTSGNDPTFGAEETANAAPSISINKPTNSTYHNDDVLLEADVDDDSDSTINISVWKDGNRIDTYEASVPYTYEKWENDSSVSSHTLKINATDSGGATGEDSVTYTIESRPIDISINDPLNQTYYKTDIPVDANVSDPDDIDSKTFTCDVKDDGSKIGEMTETSLTYTDTLSKTGDSHNLTVDCEDNYGVTSSKERYYYVWMGINVSVYDNETKSAMSNWDIEVTNGTSTFTDSGLSNPTKYEWNTLPNSDVNVTVSDGSNTKYYFDTTVEKTVNSTNYLEFNMSLEPKDDNPLDLTADPDWSVGENTEVAIECTTPEGTPDLFRESVGVSNPYTATLDFGYYDFNCSIEETTNYAPNSISKTLQVVSGGFGCTDNSTFAFNKEITPTSDPYVLNFEDHVNNDRVKDDLSDIQLSHDNLTATRNSSKLIVNHTFYSESSFNVSFGNYIVNNSYSTADLPSSYNQTNMTSYKEINPYYDLSYIQEMTAKNKLPENATTTTQLLCSGGTSSFEVNDPNVLVSSFEQLDEIKTTVYYSSTDIYHRNYLVTSDVEFKNVFLVDANEYQVVEMLMELRDSTGDFETADLRIKKYMEGTLETVTEQTFDAEDKAVIYLINGEKYSIYVTNEEETRSIGNLYVDTVDLTKTIRIGEIYTQNANAQNLTYSLYYKNETDTIVFNYVDPYENTLGAEMTVWNFSGKERQNQLYYANTTNSSVVNFNYGVPDPNISYQVEVDVHHGVFGENSLSFTSVLQGVSDALEPIREIPIDSETLTGIAIMGILIIPMIFGARFAALAGIIDVIFAAFFWQMGWFDPATGGISSVAVLTIAGFLAVMNKLQKSGDRLR